MKKPLLILLGLVVLGVIVWQTVMIYRLSAQVDKLSGRSPFTYGFEEDLAPPKLPKDNFFNDKAWDPYQEIQRMQHEMEQTFGDALSRFHMNQGFDAMTKLPALDLKEEGDRYIVKADLPGGKLSTLNVSLNGQQLTISMQTESGGEERKAPRFERRERFDGTFERTLTLPGPVRESAMTTAYQDGVLTVTLPKAAP